MEYIVDLSKGQKLLVKELFNHFNGGGYSTEHLILEGTPEVLDGIYNTRQRISISPLPGEVAVHTLQSEKKIGPLVE